MFTFLRKGSKTYPLSGWITLLSLVLVLVLFFSCSRKPRAKGPEDGVYVFHSSNLDSTVEKSVEILFRHAIMTPPPQNIYYVFWTDEEKFPDFQLFKNLMLIADLEEKSVCSRLAEKLLPPEQYQAAWNDSQNVFIKQNLWADGQVLTIIAGKGQKRLSTAILQNQEWIFSEYEKAFAYRYRHFVMDRYEQKKLTRHLKEKYNWSIRVQYEYMIGDDLPEKRFVRLVRGYPARWVSFYWEKGYKPEWMTLEGLTALRDRIGKEFYEDIYTEKRFRRISYVKINGLTAFRMRGLWAKEKETKGGPFIAYALYDPTTDRTFFIDILVFGPGEKLTIVLRQTDLMVHTFQTYGEN